MSHGIERPADSEEIYFSQYMAKVIKQSIGLDLKFDTTKLFVADSTEKDTSKIKAVIAELPKTAIKVVVAPFSSSPKKDFGPKRYGELFKQLIERYQTIEFLLIGSAKYRLKDFPLGEHVHDYRGSLKLTETAELMRQADYFIGGCSAPLHLASAVGCPSLAIYGPSSSKKWAPQHKCVVIHHQMECCPCDRIGYGVPCEDQLGCMRMIAVDEVVTGFISLKRLYG